MIRIGLLSDTHGDLHPRLFSFFEKVDEIWHAGDIGSVAIADQLAAFKPFKAVYGNIDGQDIRTIYPMTLRFFCEEVDVLITHIGGYPGKYEPWVKLKLRKQPPNIFITGHSHILRIIFDKEFNLLHINPGAAGYYGFHKKCTAIRFVIEGKDIRDLEIWEIEREKFSKPNV